MQVAETPAPYGGDATLMKVFLSSVIRGLRTYRDAASRAARALRHESNERRILRLQPQHLNRLALRAFGGRTLLFYFSVPAMAIARLPDCATHEEYREARERCPVLVFIQQNVEFRPEQQVFVSEVQNWSTGHFTADFSTPKNSRPSNGGSPRS